MKSRDCGAALHGSAFSKILLKEDRTKGYAAPGRIVRTPFASMLLYCTLGVEVHVINGARRQPRVAMVRLHTPWQAVAREATATASSAASCAAVAGSRDADHIMNVSNQQLKNSTSSCCES